MPTDVIIKIGSVQLKAKLFDTETAKKITSVLPIEADINVWGDEFYFEVPVKMPLDETATTDVDIGDIGYWPPGNAIAIFFGPTPMSSGSRPVPASEVNLVGKILDDAKELAKCKSERKIVIEKL